jgi:hypothetical protein
MGKRPTQLNRRIDEQRWPRKIRHPDKWRLCFITLSLFAALNTSTGEMPGKTAARHTSEQFVTFLEDVVASQSSRR